MEIIRRLFSFWSHHTIAGTLCRLEAQAKAAILCLCGAFPAPLLWWSGPLSLPPRTTLLLIYRIQSHTHPKRRKFCLKHAGRKSVKEELPERRKGPKRAIECRLKVPTHVWEQDVGSSSLSTRTKNPPRSCDFGGFFLTFTTKLFDKIPLSIFTFLEVPKYGDRDKTADPAPLFRG